MIGACASAGSDVKMRGCQKAPKSEQRRKPMRQSSLFFRILKSPLSDMHPKSYMESAASDASFRASIDFLNQICYTEYSNLSSEVQYGRKQKGTNPSD